MPSIEVTLVEKFYVITALITSIGSLCLGFFVFQKNRQSLLNRRYAQLSLSIGLWSFFLFICHSTPDKNLALWFNRALHFFSILIPISFYHFTVQLLDIRKKRVILFWLGYGLACFLAVIAFTPLLVQGLEPKFDFRLWPVPGYFYLTFLTFFSFYSYYSLWLIFRAYRRAVGLRREQLRLIFWGLFIGFNGGSTNFAYFYNIHIPPIGNLFVFLYLIFLAYAIIKYRLMDIKIAVTRAGIFITVYTLVLGLPIWVGFRTMGVGPWLLPVVMMACLATGGPSLYLYIQRQAEARLLAEQRKYQATLRQASAGMGRIRDIRKLLNLIVAILTRVVRIEHAFIYLKDRERGGYGLIAMRRMVAGGAPRETIDLDDPVIKHFLQLDEPLVYEVVRQRFERDKEQEVAVLEQAMSGLHAELIFPVYIRAELIAFVVMGKKSNKQGYSEDDLAVFSILSNQASLAIENALSYEDMKKTQEQLFKAEKMATIGTMADGLSHQINNRLHALGFIASDMLDTLKLRQPLFSTPELKDVSGEFEHSLLRIQDNVSRGGEIVRGLMKYSRKGEEGFVPCSIDEIIKTSYEMAQFKIRSPEFKVISDYDLERAPKVHANFTQLQEVFFNLIDNAYDATMQRKAELKEPDYEGSLRVTVKELNGVVEIVFSDNGMGVKTVDKDKLFTPFFTTKATAKKGTGLGLYVIRKIIEDNHGGKVEMRSVHGQGTDMVLRLALSRA
jgi:signal transduction histidine kinase